MGGLLRLAGTIDGISRFFAWIAAWLVLLSCLISAGNAASRYLFSLSSNAWLEIQWQMFAGIFLLGAAHVLKLNEHVRVDLLYGGASPRRQALDRRHRHPALPHPLDAGDGLVRLVVLPHELPERRVLLERRRPAALAGQAPAAARPRAAAAPGRAPSSSSASRRSASIARSWSSSTRGRCSDPPPQGAPPDARIRLHGPDDVRRADRLPAVRLSGRLLAVGARPLLRAARDRGRLLRAGVPAGAALPDVRHHVERPPARDPVLHLHGRDPGAKRSGRGPAREHRASSSARCRAASPSR